MYLIKFGRSDYATCRLIAYADCKLSIESIKLKASFVRHPGFVESIFDQHIEYNVQRSWAECKPHQGSVERVLLLQIEYPVIWALPPLDKLNTLK